MISAKKMAQMWIIVYAKIVRRQRAELNISQTAAESASRAAPARQGFGNKAPAHVQKIRFASHGQYAPEDSKE
jgi:hypothetical protein